MNMPQYYITHTHCTSGLKIITVDFNVTSVSLMKQNF